MTDYLMRDDAPLSENEWQKLDTTVTAVASQMMVGRRVIRLAGPFGIGTQLVPLDEIGPSVAWTHGAVGCEQEPIAVKNRTYIELPLIHKDFILRWRDIEVSRQSGIDLEMGPAAAAAASVAQTEDQTVIVKGLLGAACRQEVSLSDWAEPANALNDTTAAREKLAESGIIAPYALVLGTRLFASLQRPYSNSGRLAIEIVEKIADGGVYQSAALGAQQGVLVAQGAQYLDIAVAQDITTAYLGPEGMDHRFRILESLALRVKQPTAICALS